MLKKNIKKELEVLEGKYPNLLRLEILEILNSSKSIEEAKKRLEEENSLKYLIAYKGYIESKDLDYNYFKSYIGKGDFTLLKKEFIDSKIKEILGEEYLDFNIVGLINRLEEYFKKGIYSLRSLPKDLLKDSIDTINSYNKANNLDTIDINNLGESRIEGIIDLIEELDLILN